MNSVSLPSRPILASQVHLWVTRLDQAIAHVPQFKQTLSADEQARADRFYFERDRQRFIISRGQLRQILSHYLNTSAEQLEFCYGTYGKPSLAGSRANAGLQFNLAHSEEVALYAMTCDRQIGVDVEFIRPLTQAQKLAERCLSTQERNGLQTSNHPEKLFFDYWTCKEAYLKAIGSGLSKPMSQIEIALTAETAQLLSVEGDQAEGDRWSLQLLKPATDYVAALAVEGHDWQLSCWQL